MLQTSNMRLPTCAEWDRLVEITNGDNGKMHWGGIYSWCQDSDFKGTRMVRGCHSERYLCRAAEMDRRPSVGFRPVFEAPLDTSSPCDGELVTVGTLYMGDKPVKIPKHPEEHGSIQDYVPGAALRLGQPLVNPDYQITAIKAGDILVADRVLLKNISWLETDGAIPLFFVTKADDVDTTSEVIAVARTRDDAWLEMYYAFIGQIELLNCPDENLDSLHSLPIPSKEEAQAGWGRTLNGIWCYISLDHASITENADTIGFSISEFALDRNLVS